MTGYVTDLPPPMNTRAYMVIENKPHQKREQSVINQTDEEAG
jgi:hypothetical protein